MSDETEEVAVLIREECKRVEELLLRKNKSYGNSALQPVRIFSRASSREQILVRIDDKLSRISRGGDHLGEDVVLDTIGYLVLLRVLDRMQARSAEKTVEPAAVASKITAAIDRAEPKPPTSKVACARCGRP